MPCRGDRDASERRRGVQKNERQQMMTFQLGDVSNNKKNIEVKQK